MCYNNLRMYNKEKTFTLQAFTEWVSCDSNITVNSVLGGPIYHKEYRL